VNNHRGIGIRVLHDEITETIEAAADVEAIDPHVAVAQE
jgi:hypothetical protein